ELIEKDLDQYSVLRRAFVMRKSVQLPIDDQFESAIPVQSPSNGQVVGLLYIRHAFPQFNLEQVGDLLDLSRKLGMTLERHLLFHQMEHEKIKTYQLLDSIREAVLYIESSGEQIYANQALLNMFPPKLVNQAQGFRHAYERATSLFEHVDQPDALHDYIGQLMNGDIPGETIELSAFRGNLLLSAYAERIAIANVEWGMMLVLRDVT
ncbi:MAG TPA: histidine kinase, partial [Exiguobacterium sp.]|nr:histidine kinase [Exiguobacterium sp.]